MPTDGTCSWSATTLDGNGLGLGLGVGSADVVGPAEALGTTVGVAVAVAVGWAMSGRLGPGSDPGSAVPMIMSTTPVTPSTIGSAQLARRLTAGV